VGAAILHAMKHTKSHQFSVRLALHPFLQNWGGGTTTCRPLFYNYRCLYPGTAGGAYSRAFRVHKEDGITARHTID